MADSTQPKELTATERQKVKLWRGPSWAPLFALFALLSCCTPPRTQQIDELEVSVSKRTITGKRGGRTVIKGPAETARRGVGSRLGSKKTPLGEFRIAAKEADHRYGPAMRLGGYQGYRRGILVHRNLDGKPHGTNGCVCPLHDGDMAKIWRMTPVGAKIKIKL